MPQVSLYLEEVVLDQSAGRAREQELSLSRYVNGVLKRAVASEWPAGFVASFGAVGDESFVRPDGPAFADDTARADL
ncbi:MAG: hypothetical protein LBK54_07425 [Propionibacteriaceae bacterium]|jgi:hypothetical protein|nr:hypothetical protein [Propionibacteriaceae bacterium]